MDEDGVLAQILRRLGYLPQPSLPGGSLRNLVKGLRSIPGAARENWRQVESGVGENLMLGAEGAQRFAAGLARRVPGDALDPAAEFMEGQADRWRAERERRLEDYEPPETPGQQLSRFGGFLLPYIATGVTAASRGGTLPRKLMRGLTADAMLDVPIESAEKESSTAGFLASLADIGARKSPEEIRREARDRARGKEPEGGLREAVRSVSRAVAPPLERWSEDPVKRGVFGGVFGAVAGVAAEGLTAEGRRGMLQMFDFDLGDDLPKRAKGGATGKGIERVARDAEDYLLGRPEMRERYAHRVQYEDVPEGEGKKIADYYDQADHLPNHPTVARSYDAFKRETMEQWESLQESGMKFEPWVQEGQPYANSDAMRADVEQNRHLWFFPTTSGFGDDLGKFADHPLLESSGVTLNGVDLTYNDIFRAVHDYFGHAKEGFEFGPRGEHNAWLSHSAMYTPTALGAMGWETRGQNSWVNFGSHLRRANGSVPKRGDKDWIPPWERPYADQKANVLPLEFQRRAAPADSPSGINAAQREGVKAVTRIAIGSITGGVVGVASDDVTPGQGSVLGGSIALGLPGLTKFLARGGRDGFAVVPFGTVTRAIFDRTPGVSIPAIRAPDGRIFVGPSHPTIRNVAWQNNVQIGSPPNWEDGFVDARTREFHQRHSPEAAALARESGARAQGVVRPEDFPRGEREFLASIPVGELKVPALPRAIETGLTGRWYSRLAEAVRAFPNDKATPGQWRALFDKTMGKERGERSISRIDEVLDRYEEAAKAGRLREDPKTGRVRDFEFGQLDEEWNTWRATKSIGRDQILEDIEASRAKVSEATSADSRAEILANAGYENIDDLRSDYEGAFRAYRDAQVEAEELRSVIDVFEGGGAVDSQFGYFEIVGPYQSWDLARTVSEIVDEFPDDEIAVLFDDVRNEIEHAFNYLSDERATPVSEVDELVRGAVRDVMISADVEDKFERVMVSIGTRDAYSDEILSVSNATDEAQQMRSWLSNRKMEAEASQAEFEELRDVVDAWEEAGGEDNNYARWTQGRYGEQEEANYRVIKILLTPPEGTYTGGHFPEHNVVVHLRLTDRYTPDGKRVLFIEEIQSDWHGADGARGKLRIETGLEQFSALRLPDASSTHGTVRGRREGVTVFSRQIFPHELPGFVGEARAKALVEDAERQLGRKVDPSTWGGEEITGEEAKRRVKERGYTGYSSGASSKYTIIPVPDVGLKKSADHIEQALKRALVEAVTSGEYDYLAWASGKQVADLYSLKHHVDEITWTPPVSQAMYPEAKVGLAQRGGAIGGDDLDIGSDGNVAWYDTHVTQTGNKYGKTLGYKVGPIRIAGLKDEAGRVVRSPLPNVDAKALHIGQDDVFKRVTDENGTMLVPDPEKDAARDAMRRRLTRLAVMYSEEGEHYERRSLLSDAIGRVDYGESWTEARESILAKIRNKEERAKALDPAYPVDIDKYVGIRRAHFDDIEQDLLRPSEELAGGNTNLAIPITPELKARIINEGQPLGSFVGIEGSILSALAQGGAGAVVGADTPDDDNNPLMRAVQWGLAGALGVAAWKTLRRAPRVQGLDAMARGRVGPQGATIKEAIDTIHLTAINPDEFVNVSKFHLDPDGAELLRHEVRYLMSDPAQIRDEKGRLITGLRRRVSHNETMALAEELGLGVSEVARSTDYQRLTRVEMLALRNVISRNITEMGRTAEAIATARSVGDRAAMEYAQRVMAGLEGQTNTLIGKFVAARSEAGRALNSLKIIANRTNDLATWSVLAERAKGMALTETELVDLARVLGDGPEALITYIQGLYKATWGEKALTLWKAGLLTSPSTHLANLTGNTTMAVLETAKDAPARLFDIMLSRISGIETKGFGLELFRASWVGGGKGIEEAAKVMKTGLTDDSLLKYDIMREVNFDNPILDAYTKLVFRSLQAGDRVFRGMALARSLADQAYVIAKREGRKGSDLRARVRELVDRPLDTMALRAIQDAEVATFMNQGVLGTAGKELRRTLGPLGEMNLPFVMTPANVMTRVVEYSGGGALSSVLPLGPVKEGSKVRLKTKTPDVIEFLALAKKRGREGLNKEELKYLYELQRRMVEGAGRSTIGLTAVAIGYYYASQGKLTGNWPADSEQQNRLKVSGVPSNSIRFGEKTWLALDRISPLGNLLTLGADLFELAQNPESGAPELLAGASGSIAKTLISQSFLRGVQGVLDLMNDPERSASRWLEQTMSSVVPSGLGALARATDPTIRDTGGVLDAMKAKVPGASRTLPARVDALGEDRTRPGGVLGGASQLLSPFRVVQDQLSDPVRAAIVETGANLGAYPLREIQGSRGPISPPERGTEERAELLRRYGAAVRQRIERLISLPSYQRQTREQQRERIEAAISEARRSVTADRQGER